MRVDGFAAIEDYAVVGDGRTAALVARDGSVDWLCLPNFDSPSVFARVLDAERGGSFELAPTTSFESEREYVGDTNVLATTFRTPEGVARVTDALTLADRSLLSPLRELVRKVECLEGRVELAWRVEPHFDDARRRGRISRRAGTFVVESGRLALAVGAWGGSDPRSDSTAIAGSFDLAAGDSGLLSLTVADRDPLVFDTRDAAEKRLERTLAFWRSWSGHTTYDGPWRDLVVRSALALKLLVFAPSAAIVAAPTTSLPEWLGGTRNWDYRFAWVRDAAFSLVALLRLGHADEARSFFWWLEHATALTLPRLRVLYRLDGAVETKERELDHLSGYRGSRPVRVGNGASSQLQLDVYGSMIDALWLYASESDDLSAHEGKAIAKLADWVADHWRCEDYGIWEVRSGPAHFTHSKAMCWVALERASRLAERGLVPDHRKRWNDQAAAIRRFVDEQLWNGERNTYVRAASTDEVDASLLLLSLFEYDDPRGERLGGTVAAIERELRDGRRIRRYLSDDGIGDPEGGFVACSFWLVAALAKAGRVDEAGELMEEVASAANDVGLYAEELAPDGSFLGNFPQALSHLACVSAALALAEVGA
jgi:GH15 family glucan-1,4-alpha-glucosidase